MQDCWKEKPDDRPAFNDVIKDLEVFMTRDKPYVEMIEIIGEDDGYMIPEDNSDAENNASEMV